MATLSSLMDYYYEQMYKDLKVLEDKRLEIVQKLQKIAFILFFLGLVSSFFLVKMGILVPLQALLVSAMGAFLVYMVVYRHEIAGYKSLFKDQMIEKIVHFIDPSLVYHKFDSITELQYQQSQIFPQAYDRFSGSDLVHGKIEEVEIAFSDLHVEEKRRDKNGKEQWYTIFQGLFFIAEFNKNFHSKTLVLPDFAQRSLGVLGEWLQSMNSSRGELVKLDHAEFEKYFVVYGDDQIESRYILSHALMERIVQFRQKTGKNIAMSFIDTKMYLCVDYKKEIFEPILSKSLLEFSHVRDYFEVLSMMVGIVHEFKLSEKIWSKR